MKDYKRKGGNSGRNPLKGKKMPAKKELTKAAHK